jgi:hypothetical protein
MAKVLLVGARVIVSDFVHGTRVVGIPRRPETDDEILAQALYMSNHGHPDEAWEYLERKLQNTTRH